MGSKPLVAVSACLLGQKVRYDGKDKAHHLILEVLSQYCELIAVCPEVAIGLPVPRPKIRLTQVNSQIKVVQEDTPSIDLTERLIGFAKQFAKQPLLSALILQDKSPSCGIKNTGLYSESGEKIGLSSGLFADTIERAFPKILLIQASQLQSEEDVLLLVKKLSKKAEI